MWIKIETMIWLSIVTCVYRFYCEASLTHTHTLTHTTSAVHCIGVRVNPAAVCISAWRVRRMHLRVRTNGIGEGTCACRLITSHRFLTAIINHSLLILCMLFLLPLFVFTFSPSFIHRFPPYTSIPFPSFHTFDYCHVLHMSSLLSKSVCRPIPVLTS